MIDCDQHIFYVVLLFMVKLQNKVNNMMKLRSSKRSCGVRLRTGSEYLILGKCLKYFCMKFYFVRTFF